MDQLTLREKIGVNYTLLELSGAINASTFDELQQKVYSNIKNTNIVLDLENVTQIDSSGMGVILGGHNDGVDSNTKLFLMNPSEIVRHSLERTGFMSLFNIIHSVTEVSNV